MANSRKHPSEPEIDDAVGAIRLTVSQALAVIRPDRTFAIAYSGGLDSSVLLDAFVQAAGAERCFAVHIHHGLSAHADHWQNHCQAQSARRGVRFLTANVDLSAYRGMGVEAAARLARYAALRDLAHQHRANVLVLGQHADDQAETVLLQMLRGAGMAGLSAMPARRDLSVGVDVGVDIETTDVNEANVEAAQVEAALSDTAVSAKTLPLIRPFLSVRRVQLEAYAHAEGLVWIEDESNQDVRFARNALRRDVLPVIEQHFPAYRQTLSRVARHAASAQTLFDDLAQLDFDRCLQPSEVAALPVVLSLARSACLSRSVLQSLSVDRLNNLLRFWIRTLGLRAASASRLDEMVVQLHGLRRRDATVRLRHREQSQFGRLSIHHDGLVLRGYRDNVFWSAVGASGPSTPLAEKEEALLSPRNRMRAADGPLAAGNGTESAISDATEHYAGERCWHLPAWQGSLIVSVLRTTGLDAPEMAISPTDSPASAPGLPAIVRQDPLASATATASADVSAQPTTRRMRLILASNMFAAGQLSVRQRRGGERLSLGAGRPSRSLKHLFQDAGVPIWQRDVPLFYLDDALIFVPYLGGSLQALKQGGAVVGDAIADAPGVDEQVVLEWLPW